MVLPVVVVVGGDVGVVGVAVASSLSSSWSWAWASPLLR